MDIITEYIERLQAPLIRMSEYCLEEPVSGKLEQLVLLLCTVDIPRYVSSPYSQHMGRKLIDRRCIARAFLAKAVFGFTTTEMLIEHLRLNRSLRLLCGFESFKSVPSAPTFSRAFRDFAAMKLGDSAHADLVGTYVGDKIVMHLSRDSTSVEAREKPVSKVNSTDKCVATDTKAKTEQLAEPQVEVVSAKRKRGRPRKGEVVPPKEPTRLERQFTQTLEESLKELPKVCNYGSKNDSKGNPHRWIGWKAHIDWADGNIPLSVVTTSASCHDSQVAIPLMRMTSTRCHNLYDLMDAAYDASLITRASEELGHVPIIDQNRRKGEPKPVAPCHLERYKQRSTAERGNSRLKDEYGLRNLRVRGHAKAHMHIMFGVLALFVDQLNKVFRC